MYTKMKMNIKTVSGYTSHNQITMNHYSIKPMLNQNIQIKKFMSKSFKKNITHLMAIICIACSTTLFAQLEVELKPDGIVVPSMADRPVAGSSSFAQIIYNTSTQQYEYFNGSVWKALILQDGIKDSDGDTGIRLKEFGNSFPDQIEFEINDRPVMRLEEASSGSTRLHLDDGNDNVLIGELAGNSISTGVGNTFIGEDAGKVTFAGQDNVAIGRNAGLNIRNGNNNIAIGASAGININSGVNNIAIGKNAGTKAVSNNVFIGQEAGKNNASGSNTFVGHEAGTENTGGSNIFIGHKAGYGTNVLAPGNNPGSSNVAIGRFAGRVINGATSNTFVGSMAGENIKGGNRNVAIGYDAGQETSGSNNTSIGYSAGRKAGSNNVFIGSSSGANVTGHNNVFLGTDIGTYSDVSNFFFLGGGTSFNRLVTGEFDNKVLTIYGDLQIHPKNLNVSRNSHLRMMDSNGNMDEVIRRSGTDNSIAMGDVNNNGGDLHLRSAGTTSFSVLANGTARFWPMSDPPGTCNSSSVGQVYLDSDDEKLKACGRSGILNNYGWHNMF